MSRKIALYGGSFNPPGLHHREAVDALVRDLGFDQVVIVPCGPRPDKAITNDVEPIHRAAMTDLAFANAAQVRVDLFDLELGRFTPTIDLDKRYRSEGEVWHVVMDDLVRGGRSGESRIQVEWTEGRSLWARGRFVVLTSPETRFDPEDLPPQSIQLMLKHGGRSPCIRNWVFEHRSVRNMVSPSVESYIIRHRLYRGVESARRTHWYLQRDRARCMLVIDEKNPVAREAAHLLQPFEKEDPTIIVVIGGDGTMLRAIREHWRKRLPFYGINTGHLGFLLNDEISTRFLDQELSVYQLPLIFAEIETIEGQQRSGLAFNDVWVERTSGQTAWIQLKVNDEERIAKTVSDGMLIATAAGSTSYARAMGAPPLPLNTPALVLAGSNVLYPIGWRPVILPLTHSIEMVTLDPEKRPLQAFLDGVSQGLARSMKCRVSKTAAIELAFVPEHDPTLKLAQIQFPS